MRIYQFFSADALGGLFSQINQGEDIVRDRAIKFMRDKVKSIPEEVWTKGVEEYMIVECKKVGGFSVG